MFIRNLQLQNFRNYRNAAFTFDKKAVALFGRNGSGKTNVLDAIHYLSFTKSVLNNADALNVCHGENFFFINAQFEKDQKLHTVRCQFDGKKKRLIDDDQECVRFSDHIGKYPVVMIIPQDITLIWEAGEGRRRFIDQWLSQINKPYLENLVGYGHQLKQRNGLLKEAQVVGKIDFDLIEAYNEQLVHYGELIYQERKNFVTTFNKEFGEIYSTLSNSDERVEVVYRSSLDSELFATQLADNLDREIAVGRTLSGIHLDEFQFLLNGYEVRKTGSQGQQKSFLISLKLLELSQLTERWKSPPLVLLDDIFDKMDNDRISRFMQLLNTRNAGQFLISDANPERARKIFNITNLEFQEINVEGILK